jgi:hypothetical protein
MKNEKSDMERIGVWWENRNTPVTYMGKKINMLITF